MNIISLILDIISVGFLSFYWKYADSIALTIIGIVTLFAFSIYLAWDLHKLQRGVIANRINICLQMLIIWLSMGVLCVNQSWAIYLRIIVAALIIIKWLFVFKFNKLIDAKPVNIYDSYLLTIYCLFAFAPIPAKMVMVWTILFALAGIFIVYKMKLKKANIVSISELLFLLSIIYISNILEINILVHAIVVSYITYTLNVKQFLKENA